MNTVEQIISDDYARYMERFRPPRFRYFQKRNGPMFSWTTERIEGSYASMVHDPVGKGSRSGNADAFRLDEDSIRPHKLRKDAKARALRLFREWEQR